MKYYRFIFLVVVVAIFLGTRKWLDRKRESWSDTEIIRDDLDEGDAHLGRWARKDEKALIQLRLKRDGRFSYELIKYPQRDTLSYLGWHQIITVVDQEQYPRLVAVSDNGDTIINHSVSLMRASLRNVDILGLTKDSRMDAPTILFYRIKD